MFPLIETIRIDNGTPNNLAYHQRRMQHAFDAFAASRRAPDLAKELKKMIFPVQGLFKCRVTYGEAIELVELEAYIPRPVTSLQLVDGNSVLYNHKFRDRKALKNLFDQRGNCDDVLIVKEGLVTDSFYANVVFRRGNQWITPASYLLPGTQRSFLLDRNVIREETVTTADLTKFSACKLINSMLLLEGPEIGIEHIKGI